MARVGVKRDASASRPVTFAGNVDGFVPGAAFSANTIGILGNTPRCNSPSASWAEYSPISQSCLRRVQREHDWDIGEYSAQLADGELQRGVTHRHHEVNAEAPILVFEITREKRSAVRTGEAFEIQRFLIKLDG